MTAQRTAGRRRRPRDHRRKPRRLILLTAAMATAAVIAGGIAYSGLGPDAEATTPAQASGDAAPAAPAAAPARDAEPAALSSAPANENARGMVYDGLAAAPRGDRCVGVYRTDAGLCTHGPDAPPGGVDIKKDVQPVVRTKAPAADPAATGLGGRRPRRTGRRTGPR
ncbi:hypothetical protein ACFWAO_30460, partial [Streptomyces sp. NPDC059981]